MVSVELKGVHTTKKVHVSKRTGRRTVYTYYFAWRGGPRLAGRPGSPEFVKSYYDAHEQRKTLPSCDLRFLVDEYEKHGLVGLSEQTRKGYLGRIRQIRKQPFITMPFAVLHDYRSRQDFAEWHRSMLETPRMANLSLSVLRRILTWSVENGYIERHHAGAIKKFDENNRSEIVWSDAQIALIDLLPDHIRDVCLLALWTGQRQGDLLNLTWANVHADHIMLTTAKSRHRVRAFIWITPTIKAILSRLKKYDHGYLLTTKKGEPWATGFNASQKRAFAAAGINGVTFHDLRGTFENRAWQSGCTEAETYSITARAMKQQSANSYYQRNKELSRLAMEKIESTFGEQKCTKTVRKFVPLNHDKN